MGAPQTLPADFQGWDQAPATLPADFDKWDQAKDQPQAKGFWDQVKSALHPRQALDMPGAKTFAQGSKELPGSSEGANFAEALHDYDKASGGELAGGVVDILHGSVARGMHRIISGIGAGATPLAPFALPAAAAAPLATGLSVAGGVAGSKIAQTGAEAMGATPDQAALAGDVGGLAGGYAGAKLPALGQRAVLLGKTPQEAYRSALKPSTTIAPARVDRMVNTALEQEIPVSKAGVEKLSEALSDLQDKVTQTIGAGQGKSVDSLKVASRLTDTASKFKMQVNPDADLKAISSAGAEFLQNNPNQIPAAQAQAMKVGTYQQLSSKAYGEMQTATKEAQKALARGLKEELATQFPELGKLNAQESKLYDLQDVLERAVNRIGNHQIMGIGTPIVAAGGQAVTGSNKVGAALGIFKAVLDNPAVKSRLAIAMAKGGGIPISSARARVTALASGLVAASTNDPSNQDAPSSTSGESPSR